MAKAIEQLQSGLTIGHAHLGAHGSGRGSVAQQVHDGDTIIVEAAGNLSIRFLGIDTPEVSYALPGSSTFLSISDQRWAQFLSDGGFASTCASAAIISECLGHYR